MASDSALAIPPMIDGATLDQLGGLLGTWRTIDRRQAHKTALSEVFVTDIVQLAGNRYAAAAQWPRWHHFFRPGLDGHPHPLLFVESLRQAGIVLSHQFLGIPLDYQFIFVSISARYLGDVAPEPATVPPAVILVLEVHAETKGARPTAVRLEIEAWLGTVRIATATATYRCVSGGAYQRMRSRGPAAPAPRDPAPTDLRPVVHDGVAARRDVLLHVDGTNATFFDHPVDHLPGMLLMDAALSVAGLDGAASWPRLREFEMAFTSYAELEVPTVLTVESAPHVDDCTVGVTIHQGGRTAAVSSVHIDREAPL